MGQLVYYRPVAEFEKETVSLAGLPKGIYSIKISATGFEKTIRILKNRWKAVLLRRATRETGWLWERVGFIIRIQG
jgi:hypothetical protein